MRPRVLPWVRSAGTPAAAGSPGSGFLGGGGRVALPCLPPCWRRSSRPRVPPSRAAGRAPPGLSDPDPPALSSPPACAAAGGPACPRLRSAAAFPLAMASLCVGARGGDAVSVPPRDARVTRSVPREGSRTRLRVRPAAGPSRGVAPGRAAPSPGGPGGGCGGRGGEGLCPRAIPTPPRPRRPRPSERGGLGSPGGSVPPRGGVGGARLALPTRPPVPARARVRARGAGGDPPGVWASAPLGLHLAPSPSRARRVVSGSPRWPHGCDRRVGSRARGPPRAPVVGPLLLRGGGAAAPPPLAGSAPPRARFGLPPGPAGRAEWVRLAAWAGGERRGRRGRCCGRSGLRIPPSRPPPPRRRPAVTSAALAAPAAAPSAHSGSLLPPARSWPARPPDAREGGRCVLPPVAHRAPTWLILPVAYACLKD